MALNYPREDQPMKVTELRLRIITCMRMEKRNITAHEIATLLRHTHRNVSACLKRLEGYDALIVDRSHVPFQYRLAPLAYIAVGSFPPKENEK